MDIEPIIPMRNEELNFFEELINEWFFLHWKYAGLVDCDYYKENEYNYTHFVDLDTLKDARPAGYLVRVPVYVIGSRDAHIILSSTNTPNRDLDFVYEIRK